MSDQIRSLISRASQREFRDLAKLLTLLEQAGPSALEHPEILKPPQTSLRLGITGPPGAGKSTLVGQLIKSWRQRGATVGVLAIDPSSPFSGGAILGDRIRYSEHFSDPGVFIRSIGTRGSLGGLSASAYLMLRAFDLWALDIVLIETVGVGQTELDILHVADLVTVVLVPESGDSVQAMKAGLMEIADVFVVNKSDRPGADNLAREIQFYFDEEQRPEANIRLFKTVATEGDGLEDLANGLRTLGQKINCKNHRLDPVRLRHEAVSLLRGAWERDFKKQAQNIYTPDDLLRLLVEVVFLDKK